MNNTTTKVERLMKLADEALREDRLNDCIDLLNQACRKNPNRADIWALMARIELKRCNLDAHDEAINQAIRLKPRDIHLYIRRTLACPPHDGKHGPDQRDP